MAVIGWTIVGVVAAVMTTAMFREHETGGLAGALGVAVAGVLAAGGALVAGGVAELSEFFDLAVWLLVLGAASLLLAVYIMVTHDRRPARSREQLSSARRTPGRRETSARRGMPHCPAVSRPRSLPRPRRRPPTVPAASCRRSSSR